MPKRSDKKGLIVALDRMTTAEKIRAMEDLWDDLCRKSDEISSPLWHHDVLVEREGSILAGEAKFLPENEAVRSKNTFFWVSSLVFSAE